MSREHGTASYAPAFGLFECRCGERFETGVELGRHVRGSYDSGQQLEDYWMKVSGRLVVWG